MKYILARQIKGRCDFGLSGILLMSLLFSHQIRTVQPKLYATVAVDDVINAAVKRIKASAQAAVGGIHNGIDFQCSNIALPECQTLIQITRRDFRNIRKGSFAFALPANIHPGSAGILPKSASVPGHSSMPGAGHPVPFSYRNFHAPAFSSLCAKGPDQILSALTLVHTTSLILEFLSSSLPVSQAFCLPEFLVRFS